MIKTIIIAKGSIRHRKIEIEIGEKSFDKITTSLWYAIEEAKGNYARLILEVSDDPIT